MTAAGQTTWYEFANAILEEARHAPQNLQWLASATKGRPLIARRVVPISTEEFRSPGTSSRLLGPLQRAPETELWRNPPGLAHSTAKLFFP